MEPSKKIVPLDRSYRPTKAEKSAYRRLRKAVKRINPKAFKYMSTIAQELPTFRYDGDLRCCFTWGSSIYSDQFWQDIYYRLVEDGYYKRWYGEVE